MSLIRLVSFCLGLLLIAPVAHAAGGGQALSTTRTTAAAAAGAGGGSTTTQTLVVNPATSPVPTASVGTTTVAGTVVVGNAATAPIPTRDVDRRPGSRLTLLLSSGDGSVAIVDAYGGTTQIMGLPAGKLFVVNDVEILAIGTAGDQGEVQVSHAGGLPDIAALLTLSKLGAVERIHYEAGPVFANLPAIGYSSNLAAAAVTLRGFLVDAQ